MIYFHSIIVSQAYKQINYCCQNSTVHDVYVSCSSQVNYLHSHGLAHTELRLENLHICPVDRHIKVSISFPLFDRT